VRCEATQFAVAATNQSELRATCSFQAVKAAFHDTDIDTDTDIVLCTNAQTPFGSICQELAQGQNNVLDLSDKSNQRHLNISNRREKAASK